MQDSYVYPLQIACTAVASLLIVACVVRNIVDGVVPFLLAVNIAVCGAALRLLDGTLLLGLAAALVTFEICHFLWRRSWITAEDVKLLAALSLVVPPIAVPVIWLIVVASSAARLGAFVPSGVAMGIACVLFIAKI